MSDFQSMSPMKQTLAWRISDHMSNHSILTQEQLDQVREAGLKVGASMVVKMKEEYLFNRFGNMTEEDMVEILIETVKEYARQENRRDFW